MNHAPHIDPEEQEKHLAIPERVVQGIFSYLSTRPYKEVYAFMADLQAARAVRIQADLPTPALAGPQPGNGQHHG